MQHMIDWKVHWQDQFSGNFNEAIFQSLSVQGSAQSDLWVSFHTNQGAYSLNLYI